MFPENKTRKFYFHFPPSRKIPRRNSTCSVTPWPFMRSKNCLSSQENTSSKVLTLLLFYLPVFWLQISSAFGIIFANCHGLSRVHVRVSWYTALCRITQLYVFLTPQRVPSDLEVGYEKSILTRTEAFSITICFKEPLLFISLFLKRMRLYFLLISITTWHQVPISIFVSWLPKTVFAIAITPEEFACSLLVAEGKSMQWSLLRPL